MKKLFVSVGLVAAGAAGIPSLFAQDAQSAATPKMWNVSASLRGFYDDNYTVSHDKKGSFGVEVSPSVSANVDLKQTDIGVRYTFGAYYYQQRQDEGLDAFDYTHTVDLWLDHSFTERWKLNLTDSFVSAQDPALVNGGSTFRVNGDNIANRASVKLDTQWTRQFSTEAHYGNDFYDYSDLGANNAANPSEAALLNRIEQSAGIDLQWTINPETMVYIGYQYSWVRYQENQEIASPVTVLANGLVVSPQLLLPPPGARQVKYLSNSRDYDSHYGYAGISHEFSPNLKAQVRAGASYTDNYNDPISPSTSWTPYADISATYTYIPGSYVQAGFTQDINATDVTTPGANGHLTQYQQTSAFYFDINHRITPKLNATFIGHYQYSSYEQGAYSSTGDSTVSAGISLSYAINRHFSADAGYNFSELLSDIAGRDNARNNVYIGLSANY
jgi:Putative beta-barrel porin 2